MFGVINIYKPKGLTSHDVVAVVRKILKIKQVGHTGTLDPFAQGVLPICVGKATRLIDFFDDDKEYLATVKFGASTDTYDLEGKVTNVSDKKVVLGEVESALENFRGEISQLPPIYSAIKVNGKKLYEYARCGEEIEISPRRVTIYKADLKNFNETEQTAEILIKCSKGTYIRSIANDLGQNLGCFAHLTKLIRTQAGKFRVEDSVKLPIEINQSDVTAEYSKKYSIIQSETSVIEANIQNPTAALSLPIIDITEAEFQRVVHGNGINKFDKKIKAGDFLILVYNCNVVAVGQYIDKEIKVKKVLV